MDKYSRDKMEACRENSRIRKAAGRDSDFMREHQIRTRKIKTEAIMWSAWRDVLTRSWQCNV